MYRLPHQGSKKGEADLYLTELGKKFKENGNKMPEEKK